MSNKKLIKYQVHESASLSLIWSEIIREINIFKKCWVVAEQICLDTSKNQIFHGRRGFSLKRLTIILNNKYNFYILILKMNQLLKKFELLLKILNLIHKFCLNLNLI